MHYLRKSTCNETTLTVVSGTSTFIEDYCCKYFFIHQVRFHANKVKFKSFLYIHNFFHP